MVSHEPRDPRMIDRLAESRLETLRRPRKDPHEIRRGSAPTFLRLHRWIGLLAGALFVLIGLSGGLLAFREDIDEQLNASIMRVEPPAQASLKPLDEILAAAVAAMPPDAKLERLTLPRHARAAATVTYMVDSDDLESDFYELFVDPYTAQVKGRRLLLHGDKTFSQPFIAILLAFHTALLLGANNAYLVGFLGILMMFLRPRWTLSLGVGERPVAPGPASEMERQPRAGRL